MSIGKVMRHRYITDHRQISFTCDTIFDLKMLSNGFGLFFVVLKDKLCFIFSGTSKVLFN